MNPPDAIVAMACVAIASFSIGYRSGNKAIYQKHLGEAKVVASLERFTPRPFHLLNNVTLGTIGRSMRTTQIDHILVTRSGIVVIETKHYNGKVLGNLKDREWRLFQGRRGYRISNPILQNWGHLRELEKILGLRHSAFSNLVVFSGSASFNPSLEPNVLSIHKLGAFLNLDRPTIFSDDTIAWIVGKIETSRYHRSKETDEYHVREVMRHLR